MHATSSAENPYVWLRTDQGRERGHGSRQSRKQEVRQRAQGRKLEAEIKQEIGQGSQRGQQALQKIRQRKRIQVALKEDAGLICVTPVGKVSPH